MYVFSESIFIYNSMIFDIIKSKFNKEVNGLYIENLKYG